jgi:hypothetical protein
MIEEGSDEGQGQALLEYEGAQEAETVLKFGARL